MEGEGIVGLSFLFHLIGNQAGCSRPDVPGQYSAPVDVDESRNVPEAPGSFEALIHDVLGPGSWGAGQDPFPHQTEEKAGGVRCSFPGFRLQLHSEEEQESAEVGSFSQIASS